MISRLLEHGNERLYVARDALDGLLALCLYADGREPHLGSCEKEPADLCRLGDRRLEQRLRVGQSPAFEQGVRELDLELDPRLVSLLEQRCCSLEQIARAVHVAATERTPACDAELGGGRG